MKNANSKNHRMRTSRPERAGATAQTADDYLRVRDLPRLIAVWPDEIANQSPAGAIKLIRKLRNALRAERQRGRAGHWSYDLGRHMGLAKALKAEMTAFALAQEQESGSLWNF